MCMVEKYKYIKIHKKSVRKKGGVFNKNYINPTKKGLKKIPN